MHLLRTVLLQEWDPATPGLAVCTRSESEVRKWSEDAAAQRLLLTMPSELLGQRLSVYRVEGTTQWYSAFIIGHNQDTGVRAASSRYSYKLIFSVIKLLNWFLMLLTLCFRSSQWRMTRSWRNIWRIPTLSRWESSVTEVRECKKNFWFVRNIFSNSNIFSCPVDTAGRERVLAAAEVPRLGLQGPAASALQGAVSDPTPDLMMSSEWCEDAGIMICH